MPDDGSEPDVDAGESVTGQAIVASTNPALGPPGARQDPASAVPPTPPPVRGFDPAPLLARIADLEAALGAARGGADRISASRCPSVAAVEQAKGPGSLPDLDLRL